ncbi:ATP-binding protein [Serratia symbiotica]|uniref:ATP-binding protein n=1 Tax=Serratia symbiotica TaxID=138074 RepID=UPI00235194BE|nr:ATP-binding protein [Serratia symbiotica]
MSVRVYSYSLLCCRYQAWCLSQKRSMCQQHLAGEKCFIGYCGPSAGYLDGNWRVSPGADLRSCAGCVKLHLGRSHRYGGNAAVMISQLPTDDWYGCVGDNTLADAILERLMHNSHRLEMKGESMRKSLAPVDTK